MSARATTAKNVFKRSLNPWLRPHPSGPINKNQPPKRKTGINTTLDRFHKLIVDLNQKNAKLYELIENMERIQHQNSPEEEEILSENSKEEEKRILINDFHASIENHRKSLERRLTKLNEIEESLAIFRFDEPKPKPPKVEFPPVNPYIPSPRAHLRTSARFELANSISKTENDQLSEKALYLERLIIVQKMKLKLCHDHRELAKLSKELACVESSIQNESSDFQTTEPSSPKFNSRKNPRARILKNNLKNSENVSADICEEEIADEIITNNGENNNETNDNNKEFNDDIKTNEFEISNSANKDDESKDNINNEANNDDHADDDVDLADNDFDDIENQRLKNSINVLKDAIEHEKKRIKQYQSKYYRFYEAAAKIQNAWRGYNYRLKNKKQ